MCQFFSAIVTQDRRVLFCESDLHEEIIRRANLKDTSIHLRHWVRVEAVNGEGPVTVDESASTPTWWDDHADELSDLVLQTAVRVHPARDAYDAAIHSARDAYDIATYSARNTCYAATYSAWNAYDAATYSAQDACDAATQSARNAYDAATYSARNTCYAAIHSARDAYDAATYSAQDAYIHTISRIPGYLPLPESRERRRRS